MFNFNFYNPIKIVFGEGRLKKLNNLVPQNAKMLITYGGGSVKRFGVLDQVKDELSKGNREVLEQWCRISGPYRRRHPPDTY